MIGQRSGWPDSSPDILRVGIVQGTIAATTLAWSLHFVSFLDVKEAALWAGVLCLWTANTLSGRDSSPGFRALVPCWVTLVGMVLLGCILAPVPAFALQEGLRLLPLLLLASLSYDLLQDPGCRSRILSAIVGAGFGAALLALLQVAGVLPTLFPPFTHYDQDMYSVFGNEGLLAGFLAIALVTLPGLSSGEISGKLRVALIAVAVILIATLLLTESRGGLVAAFAGLVGLCLSRTLSLRSVAGVLLVAALLGTSLFLSLGLAPREKWLELFSAHDTGGNLRRWIVAASTRLVAENPLLGCGLGNYAYAIPIWLGDSAPAGGVGANTLTTYHAHLDLLEWFCETGLPGLLGLGWIASRLRVRSAPALCGLAAVMVFALFHPALYSAPHALAALLLYTMNVKTSPAHSEAPHYLVRTLAPLCFVLAFGGSAAFMTTELYPSFLLRQAEDRHLAGEAASADYERAIGALGFHPEAHESYGIHAYEQDDFALALQQFQRARAGLDTGRIHQLLGMASARLNDSGGACDGYQQCARRWPWDDFIRARQRAYCHPDTESGSGHRQEAMNPDQVSR